MLFSLRWAFIPALIAGWFLAAEAAWAITPQVNDQAGMFSKAAVTTANDEIKEIKRHYKKDLVIETYDTLPGKKGEQAQKLEGAARTKLFEEWVAQRADELNVDGIYVVICRKPTQIQVEAGRETRKKAFTGADCKQLTNRLVDKFKAKKFDDGLVEGVRYVRDTLSTNLKGAAPANAKNH